LKVLLIGHACSPRRGTEHAVTWNWAWHLAQENQVWVLTHPQERPAIERYLEEHSARNLHFVWVTVPKWCDPWDPLSGDRWIRLHYLLWQHAALRQAMRLHETIYFDVAHHVSWGTVSEPPLVSRLPVPFVWGPVGGGQVAPSAFRKYLGPAWMMESARTIRVRLAPYRPALRQAIGRSALVLATNRETAGVLQRAGAHDVPLFLDSGLHDDFLAPKPVLRQSATEPLLLWVGQLEPLKCLPLALEALAQIRTYSFHLLVAGKGSMRKEWQDLVDRLGLRSRVTFLGQIPHCKMPGLYRSADVFVFTSLRDSFGSQVLEAMGAGLPIVALDHQGVGSFMPADAGIRVPVSSPGETVQALAGALRRLLASAGLRNRMGRVSWEFARNQTWAQRVAVMRQLYEEIVGGRHPLQLRTREEVKTVVPPSQVSGQPALRR
jgi:glycosyltransferase involved in cell wall biosynthesis